MTDAQTEAREIETRAWNCDEWPEWLHKIVDETNEVADRLDMSAEQAHAYAILAALKSAPPEGEQEAAGNNYCSFCDVKFFGNICPSCRGHVDDEAVAECPDCNGVGVVGNHAEPEGEQEAMAYWKEVVTNAWDRANVNEIDDLSLLHIASSVAARAIRPAEQAVTEARAIAQEICNRTGTLIGQDCIDIIATALAANEAELAVLRAELNDCASEIHDLRAQIERTEGQQPVGVVWFGYDENTGEFTGESCSVEPHDSHRFRAYAPITTRRVLTGGKNNHAK